MGARRTGLALTTLGVLAVVPDSLVLRLVTLDFASFMALRALLASGALALGLLLLEGRAVLRAVAAPGRAGLLYAALFSASTFAFMGALWLTTVANALFIVSTAPVFAALVSRFVLGEPVGPRVVWTIVFCLLGIGIIATGAREGGRASLAGDALALCAATTLAAAFVTARAARPRSMVPAGALAHLLTAAVALPFASLSGATAGDWGLMLLLGLVFIPAGTALLALGPRYISAPEVSLLLLLEAVLAPLLVWIAVGEAPGGRALAGGAVVLMTLLVSNLVALRRAG